MNKHSKPSAKSSRSSKSGPKPGSVARLAIKQISQERQWAKDGTLTRLYREGARKRRELTKLGNEHDKQ